MRRFDGLSTARAVCVCMSVCLSVYLPVSPKAHNRPYLAMPPHKGNEGAKGLRSHGQPCQRSLSAVQ